MKGERRGRESRGGGEGRETPRRPGVKHRAAKRIMNSNLVLIESKSQNEISRRISRLKIKEHEFKLMKTDRPEIIEGKLKKYQNESKVASQKEFKRKGQNRSAELDADRR
ncbi:hypothetical protein L1987_08486 [Smallanthus sonchifolius]|uniref:Uncharacterized protein n=1 Tax=Smallanthus sonchifolius TaxID=185202 RepID=A0ACB9JNT6_9ASTR|nr:hypothetical protein L1987_08486 [Smallanthus sonchifolius]